MTGALVVIAAAWGVAALPLGVLIGRGIRLADRRTTTSEPPRSL